MKFDLIGDIHGCALTLEALLAKLGYEQFEGCYQHSDRQVIFLGDFIDRGPFQRRTLDVVRAMVEKGSALAVMGNHEFNSLAFHQADGKGGFLRPHNTKNIERHKVFTDAYPDMAERTDVMDWFKTLPMFLDLGQLRVVHAAWLPDMVAKVRGWAPDGLLTDELLAAASDPEREEFVAVENLLKGWETELPEGESFQDKDGHWRSRVRTRWFGEWPTSLQDAALGPVKRDAEFVVERRELYPDSEPPVFVGHYWLKGAPRLWTQNVCCLDYSVAKEDGHLVAYRWDGESDLSPEKFVILERLED